MHLFLWRIDIHNKTNLKVAVCAVLTAGAEMVTLLNSGPSLEFRPAEGRSLDNFLRDVRTAGIVRNVTQVWPEPIICFYESNVGQVHSTHDM